MYINTQVHYQFVHLIGGISWTGSGYSSMVG
jgi:hypothetical protein